MSVTLFSFAVKVRSIRVCKPGLRDSFLRSPTRMFTVCCEVLMSRILVSPLEGHVRGTVVNFGIFFHSDLWLPVGVRKNRVLEFCSRGGSLKRGFALLSIGSFEKNFRVLSCETFLRTP